MLLREIRNIFHTELNAVYGAEEVSSFFYLLIEHYFDLERFVLAMQPDLKIDKDQETIIFKALSELKLEKPIQHIIGTAYFMDMDFKVNEHVLIPRPETEELVRWILDDHDNDHALRVLDMGTGSGCIPISLDKNLKNAKVFGLDISTEALQVARENNESLHTSVTFFQADILSINNSTKNEVSELNQKFDIIVSNPPYVRELEKVEMRKNVLDHEPNLALFVADDNPLQFYDKIVEYASNRLEHNGCLYLEINQYLGVEMQTLLHQYGFKTVVLKKDMFGNDRMLKGVKK
ncbi:peptide chain release factor N(5)-glutamine methyltransferase [Maribacter litoralis]|uniref:Release factor glutamine methyltransferase n=1 Tax=Maribacter litoralis TaxID=2059726 RepID=A0A653XS24_9FLAO|nr:peptide chain release factor N(5)-glutamine methyltransferase [Maribacter litoralis]VXC32915.1 Release factor glutamine methyltransferase [Maribacter litoralis]